MMKMLLSNQKQAALEEYARAAKQHGPTFNGLHEAYAIIFEEADEAHEQMNNVLNQTYNLWKATRANDIQAAHQAAIEISKSAISLAAEAIQTAAMAHKLIKTIHYKKAHQPHQKRFRRKSPSQHP